jgi:metal-responsive CopG/Arc/MetJ family transcriptional regulator
MRTIITIPDDQANEIDAACAKYQISRAEWMRRAFDHYLETHPKTDAAEKAFGVWENKKVVGVKYQRKLRLEWE